MVASSSEVLVFCISGYFGYQEVLEGLFRPSETVISMRMENRSDLQLLVPCGIWRHHENLHS